MTKHIGFALLGAVSLSLPAFAQSNGFNPRSFSQMPKAHEIPQTNIGVDQIKRDCLAFFDGKKYTSSLNAQKADGRDQFWPGTYWAQFTTNGDVGPGVGLAAALHRPLCKVVYSWRSQFDAKSNIVAVFDGRFLYGRSFIMEASGRSLIITVYNSKTGVRTLGTFVPD